MSNFKGEFEGEIAQVFKNFGLIEFKVRGHKVKVHFLVSKTMLNNDEFEFARNVKFKLTDYSVRNTQIVLAYDIKEVKESELLRVKLTETKHYNDIFTYYKGLFKNLKKGTTNIELEKLVASDKNAKGVFLKWILYLESDLKNEVISLIHEADLSIKEFYSILEKEKFNVKKEFKKLKNKHIFTEEFSLFELEKSPSDPLNPNVESLPVEFFLQNLDLGKLTDVLKKLVNHFKDDTLNISLSSKGKKNLQYLRVNAILFDELSFLRNSAAHDNPLIPLIIDNRFSSNYEFDMSSISPSWATNQKSAVENYPLFQFIRYIIKMEGKEQKMGTTGSLMWDSFQFTKPLVVNQYKRSFFIFYLLIFYNLSYKSKEKEIEVFVEDNKYIVPTFMGLHKDFDSEVLENIRKESILSSFPSERESIITHFDTILYPLYCWIDSMGVTYLHDVINLTIKENVDKI